jgi:nucleotide-binding universal stress UspA family protein
MKILFATDGSACALAALKSLIERRSWFRGDVDLTVLNVHPALPFKRATAWAGRESVQKYYDEECDAALAPAVGELTAQGVVHKIEKRIGEPAPTIVAAAVEGGYDLIAMGSQGHSALAHLMLGSVATKVIAASSLPVLLLR